MKLIDIKDNIKENKFLFKYFIILFIISFFLVNWDDVSWVFNYKALSGIISDAFGKEESSATFGKEESLATFGKEESLAGVNEAEARINNFDYSNKESWIEIPKIGISVPLIFPQGENVNFEKLLDKGAVFFPDSSLPGESGQTVVLGHSAPPNWPKIKYDWIFTRISELNKGDKIVIYFNSRKYIYSVSSKLILSKGEELPRDLRGPDNVLILLSCWPPGKNYKRMAIVSILDKI